MRSACSIVRYVVRYPGRLGVIRQTGEFTDVGDAAKALKTMPSGCIRRVEYDAARTGLVLSVSTVQTKGGYIS